jgi:hypothetical protein
MSDIAERIASLPPEKRALLADRVARAERPARGREQIPRRETAGPAPLSYTQQSVWFLDQLYPKTLPTTRPSQSALLVGWIRMLWSGPGIRSFAAMISCAPCLNCIRGIPRSIQRRRERGGSSKWLTILLPERSLAFLWCAPMQFGDRDKRAIRQGKFYKGRRLRPRG